MTIGTSDGQQFGSEMDMLSSYSRSAAEPVIQNADGQSGQQDQDFQIDRDHHVPLLATALMNKQGQMYGMAVDHRAKVSDDDLSLLRLHEGTELPMMQDLIKGGMSPSEAYGEAHKWATARETAASIAKWGPEGHADYQQRMRDNTAVAKEPSDRDRHPDGHTTQFGLDESEGAYPTKGLPHVAMAGEGDEPSLFSGTPAQPPGEGGPEGKLHDEALRSSEKIQGGSVSLKPAPSYSRRSSSGALDYQVEKDGDLVGSIHFLNHGDGHYHLSGAWGTGPNTLGPSTVRRAFQEFVRMHPDATRLTATRISGARRANWADSNVEYDVKNGRLILNKDGQSPVSRVRLSQDDLDWLQRSTGRVDPVEREMSDYHEGDTVPYQRNASNRDFMDDPLRSRSGAFIPSDSPLAERGPAQFRNAMRRIGVTPRYYEGQEELQRTMERDLPVSRPGMSSLLRTLKALKARQ